MGAAPTPIAPEEPELKPEPVLTTEQFHTHLAAMRMHYKGGKTGLVTTEYQLPIEIAQHAIAPMSADGVFHARATSTDAAGTAALQSALTDNKNTTLAFGQAQQNFASQQTNTLHQTNNTAAFQAALNAQRNAAKQQSDANIDKTYDTLAQIGTAHPALQTAALSIGQKIGAGMAQILGSVITFFQNLFTQISAWLKAAFNWVVGAAQTIAKWGQSIVSTVTSVWGAISSFL